MAYRKITAANYENDAWFDVASGHEDKAGPETDTKEEWSSWITKAIADIHRHGRQNLG